MAFSCQDDFKKAVTQITKNNLSLTFHSFRSLQMAMEETNEKILKSATSNDLQEDTLVCSDVLVQLLNERYEISIGDNIYKITPIGTVFTTKEQYEVLQNIEFNEEFLSNCSKVDIGLGLYSEENLYKYDLGDSLYLFDTFSKLSGTSLMPKITTSSFKSAIFPADGDFKVIGD